MVGFSPAGQIVSVGGVPVGGDIGYQIKLNGRVVPSTLLNFPIQPSDTAAVELYTI
jgi:hypothetical protein